MINKTMELKQLIDDLAVFGGPPAFESPLHVNRPNIGDRERLHMRINDLLDRRWLTNDGPYVQAFEQQLQSFIGVKHCIATCNGTLALALAIQALGLYGEVIVPSFTFVATVHVLQWHGIQPIFCDIDPATHNLDPNKLVNLITDKTSGIIGVHIWGRSCAIDQLSEIASLHSLPLLYDAAHAFGCSYNGTKIGNFGKAEVFSFHATKYINSFEGGALATNDEKLARKIRLMRNFGFEGIDNVVSVGINAKMSEISAAMGITSLEGAEEFIHKNRVNYENYGIKLEGVRGVKLVEYQSHDQSNYQYVVLEIDIEETKISRDTLMEVLRAENILARRYFYPGCHRMEPYSTLYPKTSKSLPETERLVERVLLLPAGKSIQEEEIDIVVELLKYAIENGAEITKQFKVQQKTSATH
jgi:dTDP-4-amino-4,6-dideoxygalactose transaminase